MKWTVSTRCTIGLFQGKDFFGNVFVLLFYATKSFSHLFWSQRFIWYETFNSDENCVLGFLRSFRSIFIMMEEILKKKAQNCLSEYFFI